MRIRTKEDFTTEVDSMGYNILYRGHFLTGAGVNKANFYYDGRKKPRGRCTTSNSSLNRQAAEAGIKACLSGIPGRYLDRCNEIDIELGE